MNEEKPNEVTIEPVPQTDTPPANVIEMFPESPESKPRNRRERRREDAKKRKLAKAKRPLQFAGREVTDRALQLWLAGKLDNRRTFFVTLEKATYDPVRREIIEKDQDGIIRIVRVPTE